MIAILALLAFVFATTGGASTPKRNVVWAGGDLRDPDDTGDDIDPSPLPPPRASTPPPPPTSPPPPPAPLPSPDVVGIVAPEALPWAVVGAERTTTFEGTMNGTQIAELPLPSKLPDGRYRLRVQLQAQSGTQVCFDVALYFDVRDGLGYDAVAPVNGYSVIDPADVLQCKYGIDVGPVGTYRIGAYRYAGVNRTGFGGRGPAWAVEVVRRSSSLALQLRCARDWRQRIRTTLTLRRVSA